MIPREPGLNLTSGVTTLPKNLSEVEKEILVIKEKIKESNEAISLLIKKGEYIGDEANNEKTKIKSLTKELEKLEDERYLINNKNSGETGEKLIGEEDEEIQLAA